MKYLRVRVLSLSGERAGLTPVPWEPKVSFPSPQGSLRSDGSNGIPNITPDFTDRKGENGTMFTCELGGKGKMMGLGGKQNIPLSQGVEARLQMGH